MSDLNILPDVATNTCAPTDDMINELQNTNDNIVMNRSSIINIATYQQMIDKEYYKTQITKWVWLTFLLLYIASIIIIFILRDNILLVNIYLLCTCILGIILLSIGVFAIIRLSM